MIEVKEQDFKDTSAVGVSSFSRDVTKHASSESNLSFVKSMFWRVSEAPLSVVRRGAVIEITFSVEGVN